MAVCVHGSENISTPQENILSILHASCSRLQRCDCDFTAIFMYQIRPASSFCCDSSFCRLWFAYCHLSLYTSIGGRWIHLPHECCLNRSPLGNVAQYTSGPSALRFAADLPTVFAVGEIMFLRKPTKKSQSPSMSLYGCSSKSRHRSTGEHVVLAFWSISLSSDENCILSLGRQQLISSASFPRHS